MLNDMAQLLVRDIEDSLVRKLKLQARTHGVSAEEEHRRILRQTLSRAAAKRDSLIGFLLSEEGAVAPDVRLDLSRSRKPDDRKVEI